DYDLTVVECRKTTFKSSALSDVEIIAIRNSIPVLKFLERNYAKDRWRKLKGTATVLLENGKIRQAEVHWYEAHGIGKRQMKIKRYLD
ncbi:MAG: hypothetical protein ABR501_12040, partial [Pyrinomonadaceae bacterium]